MPVYNAGKTILPIIKSILKQSYQNFELIIVNDGSTDKTLSLINSINDNRIKIFSYKKNKGIVYALNYGFSKCNGAYIARVDSDDFSEPTRLEKQINFLLSNPEYGVCGTFQKLLHANSASINKPPINSKEINTSLLFGTTMLHSTVLIKKSVLEKLGRSPYNDKFKHCEDYNLWVDLLGITKMHNIPEVLCHYDWRETKAWQFPNSQLRKSINKIRNKAINHLVFFNFQKKIHVFHKKFIYNEYKSSFERFILRYLYLVYLLIVLSVSLRFSSKFLLIRAVNHALLEIKKLTYLVLFNFIGLIKLTLEFFLGKTHTEAICRFLRKK
jgi:glycosyltransferase involved in cell wall biosynthesis